MMRVAFLSTLLVCSTTTGAALSFLSAGTDEHLLLRTTAPQDLTRTEMRDRLALFHSYVRDAKRGIEVLKKRVALLQQDTDLTLTEVRNLTSAASGQNATILANADTITSLGQQKTTLTSKYNQQKQNITALRDYAEKEVGPILSRRTEFEDFGKKIASASGTAQLMKPRVEAVEKAVGEMKIDLANFTMSLEGEVRRAVGEHLREINRGARESLAGLGKNKP